MDNLGTSQCEFHPVLFSDIMPGKPLAAIGAAEENRQLVLDQLAAAIGQNRRTPD